MQKLKIQKCETCGMEYVICGDSGRKIDPAFCRCSICGVADIEHPDGLILCHFEDEWIPGKGWKIKEKIENPNLFTFVCNLPGLAELK